MGQKRGMAWSYAEFEAEATNADRLSMLRQHLGEVSTAIANAYQLKGRSQDSTALVTYQTRLYERLRELEGIVDNIESTDPRVKATFVRGRPL